MKGFVRKYFDIKAKKNKLINDKNNKFVLLHTKIYLTNPQMICYLIFLTTESNVLKELTALEEIGRKIASENRPNFW